MLLWKFFFVAEKLGPLFIKFNEKSYGFGETEAGEKIFNVVSKETQFYSPLLSPVADIMKKNIN
jgi:hypothetical protein